MKKFKTLDELKKDFIKIYKEKKETDSGTS